MELYTLTLNLAAFSYNPQSQPANYTGANNTTTPPLNDLAPEMKTFYDMTLLDEAGPNLVFGQFGVKKPIPKGSGKKIEFRKFDNLPKALTALTEGVTPDPNVLNVTKIEAEVAQYGSFVVLTDLLEMTAIDPIIVETTKLSARQASATIDTLDRNALLTGTNVTFASKWDGTTETPVTQRSNLDITAELKVDTVAQVVAKLRAQNAPTINGDYIAIIHPYVAYSLMRDPEWIDSHKYATPDNLYNGEIGKIAGVRFISTTEAKIWKDADGTTGSGATDGTPEWDSSNHKHLAVFATIFLGKDAYGTTEITGGGLEMIVKQRGSGDDPLNQRSTIGWKTSHVTELLHPNYMVRVESVSGKFSKDAAAN